MGGWCCPKGTTEYSVSTGCCTQDKTKTYYDDVLVCCADAKRLHDICVQLRGITGVYRVNRVIH